MFKLILLTGIVIFILFSIWYAKKKGITSSYKSNSEPFKILKELDSPLDFGYKTVWIAVKTNKKIALANLLKLKNIQPSNWESGIQKAYKNSIFITPQIGEWTIAVGMGLPTGDTLESIETLEILLNNLSSIYGEAHFFGTHRVVEYHNWMKSINGKIERVYAYIGENNQNIKVSGQLTPPEKKLTLFNSLSKEAKSNTYWDREDLDYPDEELVMKIAENWSINPVKLSQRTDIKQELGLIGK